MKEYSGIIETKLLAVLIVASFIIHTGCSKDESSFECEISQFTVNDSGSEFSRFNSDSSHLNLDSYFSQDSVLVSSLELSFANDSTQNNKLKAIISGTWEKGKSYQLVDNTLAITSSGNFLRSEDIIIEIDDVNYRQSIQGNRVIYFLTYATGNLSFTYFPENNDSRNMEIDFCFRLN